MLETVRQYARDRLLESGEADRVRARHLEFFRRLAEEAEPQLYQANLTMWLERLGMELENIRAAMESSIDSGDDVESGLSLASDMWLFWEFRGNLAEGLNWLEKALAKQGNPTIDMSQESSTKRARAISRIAFLWLEYGEIRRGEELAEEGLAMCRKFGDKHDLALALAIKALTIWAQGDVNRAKTLLEDSLALFQEVGHKWYVAVLHFWLADFAFQQDDYDQATSLYQKSLVILRELGDKISIATIIGRLGLIASARGNYNQAMEMYQESLAQHRTLRVPVRIAGALNVLGATARLQGDFQQAEVFYSESLALNREQGLRSRIASVLHNLAYIIARRGDYTQATAFFKESLVLSQDLDDNRGIAECLAGLAGIAGAQGRAEWAARLFGAAEARLEAISARLESVDRAEYERYVNIVRAELDNATFEAAWAEGRAMTLEQAVAYTLEQPSD
jgi:tetratricopeptide (TPR) repeat protein